MDTLMKADIFFFVTTIVVVVIGLLLAVLIIYFIKIFHDIKYITAKAKKEADLIAEDLSDLRQNVRYQGFKFRHLWKFFDNLRNKRKD